MHGSLILVVLITACWLRWRWQPNLQQPWTQRWHRTLMAFCLPPLMMVSAAIAVIGMGHHGSMLGLPVLPYGCWLSAVVLGLAMAALGVITGQGAIALVSLRRYPTQVLEEHHPYCLPTSAAFAAQIGFWQSHLVISQGLLDILTREELQAVLAHEQAHAHFRDTFWFFWLGWLRRLGCWLPKTETLWQELLLLREIRADRWAAKQVDGLLLAEVLVKLVALPWRHPAVMEAFSHDFPSRLEQRIEALISPETSIVEPAPLTISSELMLGFLPLMSVLLHGG